VSVITDENNPQPYGVYDLEIPDEVHALGGAYESISPFAKTWFRVGHSGDRYLHTGSISAGCTTVTEVTAWTAIYNYLIARRKGDGRSVAVMRVVRRSWERHVPQAISDIVNQLAYRSSR
jgi:hypothetical protein